jgi:hypothetical protein
VNVMGSEGGQRFGPEDFESVTFAANDLSTLDQTALVLPVKCRVLYAFHADAVKGAAGMASRRERAAGRRRYRRWLR